MYNLNQNDHIQGAPKDRWFYSRFNTIIKYRLKLLVLVLIITDKWTPKNDGLL